MADGGGRTLDECCAEKMATFVMRLMDLHRALSAVKSGSERTRKLYLEATEGGGLDKEKLLTAQEQLRKVKASLDQIRSSRIADVYACYDALNLKLKRVIKHAHASAVRSISDGS